MPSFQLTILLLSTSLTICVARATPGKWNSCDGRLERTLEALSKDTTKKSRLVEGDGAVAYQQDLRSVPVEMTVSRFAVKLPRGTRDPKNPWARVDRCVFEPNDNSLRTRVVFNDLSVSGVVSLHPQDRRASMLAETCRMTLRLRRAGVDFFTSPVARGSGHMRIRTESSFLEPRFASIYAYGCHSARHDKQIKRQDKWTAPHSSGDELTMPPLFDDYEAAEPRELLSVAKEVDVAIVNESRQSLDSSDSAGIWRKNVWVTKSPIRRSAIDNLEKDQPTSVKANIFSRDGKEAFPLKNRFKRQEVRESVEIITPEDFATALVNKKLFKSARSFGNCSSRANEIPMASNTTSRAPGGRDADDCTEARSNLKMEDAFETNQEVSRETRELMQIEDPEGVEIDGKGRSWQNEEYIAREMEDIFLRGASQALTNYIERQLHPAIKETLMLSMGYTISYG